MARAITLVSPMSPDAIATRLQTVLHDVPKSGCVTGNGSQEKMRLFFYRPNFQNSFRCELNAAMAAADGGTRIDGRIGTPTSGKVFMAFWFGFLGLFILLGGGVTIVAGAPYVVSLGFVLIPLGMMAFGALIWWVGTRNAVKDEAAILAFLAETINARPRSVGAA